MPKAPKPQVLSLVSIANPLAVPDPWTRETYRLIADFKVDFDRQRGRGASEHIGESFLLMASDHLLATFDSDAHWNKLDVCAMFERYAAFATVPGFKEGMVTSLGAFYCYLGNIGRVSPEMHGRMRALSLDCCVIGIDAALASYASDALGRCVTKPMWRAGTSCARRLSS